MATKKQRFAAEKRDSLKALAAVAAALKLPPGEAPTAEQFRQLAPTVAPEWTVHRVTRVWGRWRLATLQYAEGRRAAGRTPHHPDAPIPHSTAPVEKALRALRLWLSTTPRSLTIAAYEEFAEKFNDKLGPDDEPLPMTTAIYNALKLNWDESVRVGNGEVTLEDARPYVRRNPTGKYEDREGPYGLISATVFAEICGVTKAALFDAQQKLHNFPSVALVLGDIHLWRRSDAEAFARGDEVPSRPFNELADEYATVSQIAAELGLDASSVRVARWMPEPEIVASGRRGYRRSDFRDALSRRGAKTPEKPC